MAAHPRKLSEEQRRALQLLASIPFGASETIMFAHGFKRKTLAGLVLAGLATAERKTVRIHRRRPQGDRKPLSSPTPTRRLG